MRFFSPRSIQTRLVLSHLLVSLFSVALIAAYAGHLVFSAVRQRVEDEYGDLVLSAAHDLEGALVDYRSGKTTDEPVRQVIAHVFANRPEVHYTLYLPDGVPLVDSLGTLPPPVTQQNAPELWEALTEQNGTEEYIPQVKQVGESFAVATHIEHDQQIYGLLSINVPLEQALMPARSSLGLLVASALVVGLGMSVIGYFLARSLAEPIERVAQTAESLASGMMDARVVPPKQPQEMSRLAEAFNDMAARLQTQVVELRTFVANASHELRTPLTSIKLRVEALRSGALDDPPVTERFLAEIEGEVDRLSSTVNDLLDLSRIETQLDPSQHSPIDLTVVANDVYEAFKVRADRAEIELKASIQPGMLTVIGNEDQLRRMLYNLVDNAIKYTSRGGEVEISLENSQRDGAVLLKVRDTGFGIAPAHLPHIFERFYRVEATRPRYGSSQGSGLGLSIAKSIIEAHGGTIGVSSQLGKGTTFWVELPASGFEAA